MNLEGLAQAGREGGPLTLRPGRRTVLPLHLGQAHTGMFVCFSLRHCVLCSQQPRWEGVAWSQNALYGWECRVRQFLLS